jgi:exodeoxyribonuclease V alpha subunit
VHGLAKDGALVDAAREIKDGDEAFNGRCSDAARALFDVLDASRILSVVRKGPFGVQHVNELLLGERLGRNPVQPLVDCGIPVVVTMNTRSLNLYNGDVGVTVKTPRHGVCVLFPRGEEVVCCPVLQLPEHELAYAMTVHKSQGSEFENVLVVLPDDKEHPLLNRQIVYAGITRAKKRAVVVGGEAVLEAALSRRLVRDTGLAIAGR